MKSFATGVTITENFLLDPLRPLFAQARGNGIVHWPELNHRTSGDHGQTPGSGVKHGLPLFLPDATAAYLGDVPTNVSTYAHDFNHALPAADSASNGTESDTYAERLCKPVCSHSATATLTRRRAVYRVKAPWLALLFASTGPLLPASRTIIPM
jgi:hypothetical protein